MNSEIERAFVAALTPVMAPWPVCPGLSSEFYAGDAGGIVVDASAQNEGPVNALWRLPIVFRVELPALIEGEDQAATMRAVTAVLCVWLKNRAAVQSAFISDVVQLIPGYHMSGTRHTTEGDRIIAEIEITAGFLAI